MLARHVETEKRGNFELHGSTFLHKADLISRIVTASVPHKTSPWLLELAASSAGLLVSIEAL